MIVIDNDMPTCCQECPMRQKGINTPSHYCMVGVGRKLINDIYNSKADFCPIKCDIEDIKAEINEAYQQSVTSNLYYAEGLEKAFEIMDKHISGNMKGDTDANCD